MARKRSGGRGGSRRSRAFRESNYRAVCKSCGKEERVPTRPPPGVELLCMDCVGKQKTAD